MSFCPNVNLPEWKALEEGVGKFEAYRDFIETNGEIRSPEVVKKKLMMREKGQEKFQLERPGEQTSPQAAVDTIKNLTERLAAKFDDRAGFSFEHLPEARYKGKVIDRNGTPHIVINTAKATLDTPLHEFGHVFVAMLRMGNYRVYNALVEKLERDKTFQTMLENTKAVYANENLSPEELIEETIVQMLGMRASDLIDQSNASYNLVEEIWRAIVSFIKRLFQGDIDVSFIDLNMIDRNDPLQNFAHILASDKKILLSASPDTQAALQNQDALYDQIDEYYKKSEAQLDFLIDNSQEYSVVTSSDPNYVQKTNSGEFYLTAQVVTAETKEKLQRVKEKIDTILSEVNNQRQNPTWIKEFIDFVDQAERSGVRRDQIAYMLQTKDFKKKFSKLFWFAKYHNAQSAMPTPFMDLMYAYVDGSLYRGDLLWNYKNTIGRLAWELNLNVTDQGEFNELAFVENLSKGGLHMKTVFDFIDVSDGPLYTFSNVLEDYRTHDKEAYLKDYLENTFNRRSTKEHLEGAKETIAQEYSKFKSKKKDAIIRRRDDFVEVEAPVKSSSFSWEGVNPFTGQVVTDNITVRLKFYGDNRIGVDFESEYTHNTTGGRYGDAMWIVSVAKPEHNIPKGSNIVFSGSYKTGGNAAYLSSSDDSNFYIRLTDPYMDYLLGSFRVNDFQDVFGKLKEVEEELPDGTTKTTYELALPKRKAHMIGFKTTMNRGVAIMDGVMTEINRLSHFLPIKTVSFSAAGSDYNAGQRSSTMRTGTYQMSAMRAFGKRYVAQKQGSFGKAAEFKTRDEIQEEYNALTDQQLKDLADQYSVKKYRLIDYIMDNYKSQSIVIPEYIQGGFKIGIGKPLYQLESGMGSSSNTNKANAESTFSEDPSIEEIAMAIDPASASPTITEAKLKQGKAIEFMNKLSLALGVPAEMITEEQAIEITKNAKNPWTDEAAFFLGGQIYFVEGKLTTDLVMHEFAHPIVRQMMSEAGTKDAIMKIYDTLRNTIEGKEIIDNVQSLYPELENDSARFIEEVVVKALQIDAMRKINNEENTPAFIKALKEILFQIKQFLRKVFGKPIPVSKIDSSTTLDQLSDILVKGGKIEIKTEVVSDEELAAYSREAFNEVAIDLEKVDTKEIQSTINTFFDVISEHINLLQKNHNYDELADILMDPYERGELQQMRSNLTQWQSVVANKAEEFIEDMKESRTRIDALTGTLFRLQNVMEKIYEHTKEVSQRPDSQENMHKAFYYKQLLDYWEDFMTDFQKVLDAEDTIPGGSPLLNLTADINKKIRQTRTKINDMFAWGAKDAIYEQLEPMGRNIRQRYEKMLKDMEEGGAPQARIDQIFEEYHGITRSQKAELDRLKELKKSRGLTTGEQINYDQLLASTRNGLYLDKDKIEALLKGNMGDANWFQAYLEGYLYNNDPIVGGLAVYVKNAVNDVMIVSARNANEFADAMKPLLEDAGYNYQRLGGLGERIGFKDTVARWNRETGEFEERKVWTLLNKFKDYRFDEDRLEHAVTEAQKNYMMNKNDQTREALAKAVADRKAWMRKYMHQEYVQEFYDRYDLLGNDAIGQEAAMRRDEIMADIRKLSEPARTQQDLLGIASELDLLWRKYRQLHSRYTLNGKLKTDTEAEIAKRLRVFREQSREFYEYKIRRGVFENAYFDFLQELHNDPNIVEGDAQWLLRVAEWKKRNSRQVIKQEWYDARNNILNKIKILLSNVENREEVDKGIIWEKILEQASGFRDDSNYIIGSEIEPGAVASIKALQKELERMKLEEVQASGLTRAESQEMSRLLNLRKERPLNRQEQQDLDLLWEKRGSGLSSDQLKQLSTLYEQLSELTSGGATPYYVDIVNNLLSKMDTSVMFELYKTRNISEATADILLDERVIKDLIDQNNAEFNDFFNKNHYSKTTRGAASWKRLYIWNTVKPSDASMMESYEIKDAEGNVVDTIQGLPSMDYYARVVKTKYRTRKIVGETVDNRGRFLPREDVQDTKYINEDYEKLKQEDPAMFKVLEKMKEFHLKHQDGLSYRSRLYLDFPRFQMEGLEVWQSQTVDEYGKKKWNALSQWASRVKQFWFGEESQAEDGFNYEDNLNLVRADLFDNRITNIPIHGLYDIPVDEVSTNIIQSMLRYMHSAERQKQLTKISPVVRAIQETVNNIDNAVNSINDVNGKELKNRNVIRYLPKSDNIRATTINNLIEREFDGKTQASQLANVPWLNNTANLLFKRASFSFFALNIPSALKNSLGMKFQAMIEASGGQYVDHTSLQQGNAWSYVTMGELSSKEIYTRGAKSHRQQLVDVFDAVQGRFSENIGKNLTRTLMQDAVSFSWLYSPRKWVEIQAGIQLFAGMMYFKKLKMQTADGEQEISYIDAFETVDGQIRLKDGIDARYATEATTHFVEEGDTVESLAKKYNMSQEDIKIALRGKTLDQIRNESAKIEQDRRDDLADLGNPADVTDPMERQKLEDRIDAVNRKYDARLGKKGTFTIQNSEFKAMKNRMHQVQNNMGGAYAKFDQPEAQRYVLFRFISYLRRYFTTMFINRFGFAGSLWDPKKRLNVGLGDYHMGFYMESWKVMRDALKYGGANLSWLQDSEKAALKKLGTEMFMLMATTALMGLLFGWDPDDDERYEKLRQMSGSLPTPFSEDKEGRPDFNMLGYLEAHTLHMLMQVRGENEQFNPLLGGLGHYNSLLDIKSVAFGPTTDSYLRIWADTKALALGSEDAYYSRDVGPYDWQKQGSAKYQNRLAKIFGLTGASLDPAMAIQNFQTYQAKIRK